MIRLRDIRKQYDDFSVALDFTVETGELVSLLGPSGSGKTTTLRLIAGFERPDSGQILIDGADVTGQEASERNIGFVFQDYTLFPHMNVRDNVAYGLKTRKIGREKTSARVEELLAMVNLTGYGARRVGTLSGGEQQRAAIARSLAPAPVLFLLDEPFSSIDAPLRRELRDEIVRLREELGVTTVFVTHSRQEALSISDRVAVMRDGQIVQFDTPPVLYNRPVDRFVASFVGEANFIPGRYEGKDGDLFRVSGAVPVAAGHVPGPGALPSPGEPVSVMVRPGRLRFRRSDTGINLRATVGARRFFGHFYEYRCRAEGLDIIVFDDEERRPGDSCTISFEPADAVMLRD